MQATAKSEKPEKPKGESQLPAIRENLLQTLGTPKSLLTVQVRFLWSNNYRVNVLVGPDFASSTIAHSYFLETDAAGAILKSTPPIHKQY